MFSHYISFTETETTRGIAWYTIGIEKSRPRYTVGNVRKHDVPSVYLLLLIVIFKELLNDNYIPCKRLPFLMGPLIGSWLPANKQIISYFLFLLF